MSLLLRFCLVYCFVCSSLAFSQNVSLSDFESSFRNAKNLIRQGKLDSSFVYLKKLQKYNLSNVNRSELNSYLAYYFRKNNIYDSAVSHYQNALNFYEKDSLSFYKERFSAYKGLSVIYSQISNDSLYFYYLNKAIKEAIRTTDSISLSSAYNNLGVYFDKKGDSEKSNLNYRQAYRYSPKNYLIAQNLGSSFIKMQELDSANYYLRKAIFKSKDSITISLSYYNLSRISGIKSNVEERFRYLKEAEKFLVQNSGLERELHLELFNALSETYEQLGNWKQALSYANAYHILNDSLNKIDVQKNLDELRTKYETDKKEEQLATQRKLTQEEKQKKMYSIIILTAFVIFILIISYLSRKNLKRKQLLAEKEKQIETQKNLTLLKEQEISTINAMVEGQEKERKRVAEDLHDNLGSVLATLKLHFENLQINREKKKVDQDSLFDKTENLIDEAYLKVRSIAHAKNAGVIANEGLLTAVKIMADKISLANAIQIDVIHFGLEAPIDNSMEITVFRMIQELIANAIKHANATNATINLSRHDDLLNIIVEDNGQGFDPSMIGSKSGMGLNSIKTRVAHHNGELIIDTTPNKGTTIIINIPMK